MFTKDKKYEDLAALVTDQGETLKRINGAYEHNTPVLVKAHLAAAQRMLGLSDFLKEKGIEVPSLVDLQMRGAEVAAAMEKAAEEAQEGVEVETKSEDEEGAGAASIVPEQP